MSNLSSGNLMLRGGWHASTNGFMRSRAAACDPIRPFAAPHSSMQSLEAPDTCPVLAPPGPAPKLPCKCCASSWVVFQHEHAAQPECSDI
eukprot:360049-Chlamydomonas_euryale.AAC.11